jgi:hypothetical protein
MRFFLAVLVSSMMFTESAQAYTLDWVPTTNGGSCKSVCAKSVRDGGPGQPVNTGIYKKNSSQPFYACAHNANGEGMRPGYNLMRSGFTDYCRVGWNGQEFPAFKIYSCLCKWTNSAPGTIHQVGIGEGDSCSTVCGSSPAYGQAIVSGHYKGDLNEPFYLCTANANNEGYRGGYNLERPGFSTQCTVGWGGKEHPVKKYRCYCFNQSQ